MKKRINHLPGFTLIELLISITIIGVIAGLGFVSIRSYSTQRVQSDTAQNFASALQLARSRAQTQVKPTSGQCLNNSLNGYRVTLSCESAKCTTYTGYTLSAVCGGQDSSVITQGSFPSDVVVTLGSPVLTPTVAPQQTTTYLSDIGWVSAVGGYGPVEKNKSNGENAGGDGNTITLNGVTYTKGLGTHAASEIRYSLNSIVGSCSTFSAAIGIDDEIGYSYGSVIFQVFGDGVKLYDSGVMNATTATKLVNVTIFGRQELSLVVADNGDGIGQDHADWADAKIICGPPGSGQPETPIGAPTSSFLFETLTGNVSGVSEAADVTFQSPGRSSVKVTIFRDGRISITNEK